MNKMKVPHFFLILSTENWTDEHWVGEGSFFSLSLINFIQTFIQVFAMLTFYVGNTVWQAPWDQTRVRYWKSEPLQNEAIFSRSFWENKTEN